MLKIVQRHLYKLINWPRHFSYQQKLDGEKMPYLTNSHAQHVWSKARPIKGKNPNLYRRDSHGNIIFKPAYGRSSRMGWQVDHIFPKSKGGSNSRKNLQALQTRANKRKSNKIPKQFKTSIRKKRR